MTMLEQHPLARGALLIAVALILFGVGFAVHEDPEPPAPIPTSQALTATATPSATATPEGSPSATPEPTSTPRPGPEPAFGELPPALDTDEAGTWEWELLVGDQQPSTDHGVLIRNFGTGDNVHWWFVDGPTSGEVIYAYGLAGDGRFATFGSPARPERLVDRPSDAAVHWDTEELRFIAASVDGRVLLGTTAPEDAVCLYWAFDLASGAAEPLLRFGVEGNRFCGASAVFGPAGSETLLLRATNDSTQSDTTVYAVDLAAGSVTATGDTNSYQTLIGDDDGAVWVDAHGNPQDLPIGLTVSRYDRASATTVLATFDATADGNRIGPVLPAPNGRYVAWQESLRLGSDSGLGGWHEWPVVVVADLDSGEVLLRVVRGALNTGVGYTSWLGDSSALVITIEGQFALLELGDFADGSLAAVTPLPFVLTDHFDAVPDPSPSDPALFAYDHRFVNAAGIELFPPLLDDWARTGVRGDWTSGGAEYYLATEDAGAGDFGDGPLAPLGLGPRLQFPPFDNEVRLVVIEATGLHAIAQTSSAATWDLDAGTTVTVENDGSQECLFNFGCATLLDRDFDDPRPWWIFVRTGDGRAGWAQSSALDWAN